MICHEKASFPRRCWLMTGRFEFQADMIEQIIEAQKEQGNGDNADAAVGAAVPDVKEVRRYLGLFVGSVLP